MAENLDSPSLGTFGIEDTIEMGMGSNELLKDFFGSDSPPANPDEVEPIVKEVKDEPPKPAPVKGKTIPKVEEGEKPDAQSVVSSFLGSEEEEEEEEEEQESADPVNEEETEVGEEEDNQFNALSRDLFKLGVFTLAEEEDEPVITTGEEFLQRFNDEKKRSAIEIVNNFIGQFGEDYQDAFDAIFVKGVNPRDYFSAYNNIVNFAEMNLSGEENEGNQIAVIKKALSDQGFDPEDITTEIERLKNYGDLESVATKHHKVLVKKEASRLKEMQEASERELQMKAEIKNQYIQNVSTVLQEKLKAKEFDGIPINPRLAAELQDFLLVDKYKTRSGETLTDFDRTILELKRPENHAMKVKIALLLKVLEKDPTLSTIQKSGVTKKTDQLFGEVARQTTKSKTGVSSPKRTSWFS